MSHYSESLDAKGLVSKSHAPKGLVSNGLGLPAARMPAFMRHLYRSTRRLLRSIAARIDLSQFPGSCCG
ncbi:hypothetical protein ACNJYD_12105 [Bradyrhizobium sp. DASA03005]|uniref:hypothetical protein n=1 Tax=Bradyrhizobium TaxID=374 RepID=UPI00155F1ECB|nr:MULTISPECIES: hypothetical protein [Bradyrhizobium]MBR1167252.1 hypothetical protein [Bradyrhizobium liaoningense]UUO31491.1 hypothetical protein DCG74_31760 [Bradyrhizobium sp. WBAH42]